jgi:hypothetical protein
MRRRNWIASAALAVMFGLLPRDLSSQPRTSREVVELWRFEAGG